jgi:hypothetical protein
MENAEEIQSAKDSSNLRKSFSATNLAQLPKHYKSVLVKPQSKELKVPPTPCGTCSVIISESEESVEEWSPEFNSKPVLKTLGTDRSPTLKLCSPRYRILDL